MKKVLVIYWLLTFLLFAIAVAYLTYGISLNGYWSDKVLFACWLVMTVAVTAKKLHRWRGFAIPANKNAVFRVTLIMDVVGKRVLLIR